MARKLTICLLIAAMTFGSLLAPSVGTVRAQEHADDSVAHHERQTEVDMTHPTEIVQHIVDAHIDLSVDASTDHVVDTHTDQSDQHTDSDSDTHTDSHTDQHADPSH